MAFDPSSYVTVAERLSQAHEAKLVRTIVTECPQMLTEVMGYVRCTIEFTDGSRATGTGTFRLDAKHGAQKTNPIEDAETSAVGRALAFLGVASSKSVASREEIYAAQSRQNSPDTATMTKTIKRARELLQSVTERGYQIDHELAGIPLQEMAFDELVIYGKYLKSLLN